MNTLLLTISTAHRRAFRALTLLGTCTLLAACGSGSNSPSSPFSAAQVREIEAQVDQIMTAHRIPGVIVGVWEGDAAPLILARGLADTATGEAIAAADRFRIASVTKTFTATVVLQLIDQGVGDLTLETTLDRFFPEVPNAATITVRQLLDMTAGVYDFFYHDPDVLWSYLNEPLRQWTAEELYTILIAQEPAFPPGERCEYSNANYFLLGQIAEQVTGNALADEVRTRILTPLGLDNTSYPTTPDMAGAYTHGYRDSDPPGELEDITRVDPSLSGAGGAMISNLYDLKTWVEALYAGDLLSAGLQDERLTWQTMSSSVRYGLGVMDLRGFIGHNGEILGYTNFSVFLPGHNATIVVMANKCNEDGTENNALELFAAVTRILYPDLMPSEN